MKGKHYNNKSQEKILKSYFDPTLLKLATFVWDKARCEIFKVRFLKKDS